MNRFWRNLTGRKYALNQVCIFRTDPSTKMAAPASEWLRYFCFVCNCWTGFSRILAESKHSTSSTQFVFFRADSEWTLKSQIHGNFHLV